MPIVALTELKGDLEAEAPRLAELLGVSTYDVKARLTGPLPKILVQTSDDLTAARVLRGLTARGHSAVLYDPTMVVPTSHMVRLHRFTLDAGGVWANDREGDRLEWADLGVVVVAVLRGSVARTSDEVEYQMPTKSRPSKVTYEVTKTERTATHVAYLFPHARALSQRPWVLEEAGAQFMSLGARMQPTRRGNFFATITALRGYAPNAIVDDRFVASPLWSQAVINVRGSDTAPASVAAAQIDVTVHVLATWLMRARGGGPYRG